ncbi:MAG: hypothetical protein WC379_12475 [Methanoregula sp.]|jgi:lipopolysaccharide/colanic/teichoic acid biosynthesis glycosyltransferase
MTTGRPGQTRFAKIKSWVQVGREPPVDKDGVPSLSDYTPQPQWKEDLKRWLCIAVAVIAAIIIVPLIISAGGITGSKAGPVP